MERILPPKYNVEQEPIVISKAVFTTLIKEPRYSDLLGLYCFYYSTAKWQHTDQPRATINYTAKGIGWGIDKVKLIKARLKALGLVEDVVGKNKNGQIVGHYIHVNLTTSGGNLPLVVDAPLKCFNNSNIIPEAPENVLKKNKEQRNAQYLPLAKYLSKVIQTNINIKHTTPQIKSWANDIRRLVEENTVTYQRIEQALQWYRKNIGGEYVPVIQSGDALRKKFTKLEAAIARSKTVHNNKHQPKYVQDNTGRYNLCADGEYRHCVTNEVYIP